MTESAVALDSSLKELAQKDLVDYFSTRSDRLPTKIQPHSGAQICSELLFEYFAQNLSELPQEACTVARKIITFHSSCNSTQSSQEAALLAETEVQNLAAKPTVKHFWGTKSDSTFGGSTIRWSEYADPDAEERLLRHRAEKDSIIIRHLLQEDPDSREKKWQTRSVLVQSRVMKNILDVVLKGYPNLACRGLSTIKLKPPFQALVHRWKDLLHYGANSPDEENRIAADALVQTFEPLITHAIQQVEEIKNTRQISFGDLWLIFSPGTTVVTSVHGLDLICRVKQVDESTSKAHFGFQLLVEYVDWNGSSFGLMEKHLMIAMFNGRRSLQELTAYPFWLCADQGEFRNRMVERGRLFEQLVGVRHKFCRDRKLVSETTLPGVTKTRWKPTQGKVIVDAYAYYKCQELCQPQMAPLTGSPDEDDVVHESTDHDITGVDQHHEDSFSDISSGNDVGVEEAGLTILNLDDILGGQTETPTGTEPVARTEFIEHLSDEDCLLANPLVKGFDLKSMEWGEFPVENLEEIKWQEEAFDRVVLPAFTKQLVVASVNSRRSDFPGFQDIISNKGSGLIIVLFGPPGVGKTLTVEAISEKSNSPLYHLTAGELGTDPSTVERKLSVILECCKLWNAILLIDEADVFLATRSPQNMQQNELISIFLRHLEYFEGIMFLTTNRIETVDLAFRSRIDIILPYKDLDPTARRQIWGTFISRTGGAQSFDVRDSGLDQLALVPVNGREIKNLLKYAQIIAADRRTRITTEMLQELATMRLEAQKSFADC